MVRITPAHPYMHPQKPFVGTIVSVNDGDSTRLGHYLVLPDHCHPEDDEHVFAYRNEVRYIVPQNNAFTLWPRTALAHPPTLRMFGFTRLHIIMIAIIIIMMIIHFIS